MRTNPTILHTCLEVVRGAALGLLVVAGVFLGMFASLMGLLLALESTFGPLDSCGLRAFPLWTALWIGIAAIGFLGWLWIWWTEYRQRGLCSLRTRLRLLWAFWEVLAVPGEIRTAFVRLSDRDGVMDEALVFEDGEVRREAAGTAEALGAERSRS